MISLAWRAQQVESTSRCSEVIACHILRQIFCGRYSGWRLSEKNTVPAGYHSQTRNLAAISTTNTGRGDQSVNFSSARPGTEAYAVLKISTKTVYHRGP
jgi:uncharacterized Fe-S radical SAM superfamily protein PflX